MMKFDLDHDWQGNMSTPRARVGERAKTHLLLVLCAIWLFFGLIGHSPWKPFESQSISVIQSILDGGSWLTPMAVSHTHLNNPPLYYLVAAAFSSTIARTRCCAIKLRYLDVGDVIDDRYDRTGVVG